MTPWQQVIRQYAAHIPAPGKALTTNMKRCNKCKEVKPRVQFYSKSSNKDGNSGYCIPCDKQRRKKYRETS